MAAYSFASHWGKCEKDRVAETGLGVEDPEITLGSIVGWPNSCRFVSITLSSRIGAEANKCVLQMNEEGQNKKKKKKKTLPHC